MISVRTCAVSAITAELAVQGSPPAPSAHIHPPAAHRAARAAACPRGYRAFPRPRRARYTRWLHRAAHCRCVCRIARRPPRIPPPCASLRANGSVMSNTAATSRSCRASTTLFAKRLADQDQPLRRQALQIDRAARRDLFVLFRGELDDARSPPRGARRRPIMRDCQAAQELVFLQRIQPDQDHDAIAEQTWRRHCR